MSIELPVNVECLSMSASWTRQGVCVQCSLASGEPMTLTRKLKVEVSFVAADLSIIRAQLSALVCANASHAILSTGCLARKGWSVVISALGNLALGTTWCANVGWVHSVSHKKTSLTAQHVSEALDEGRAIHRKDHGGGAGTSVERAAGKGGCNGSPSFGHTAEGSSCGKGRAAGEDGADFATHKFFYGDKLNDGDPVQSLSRGPGDDTGAPGVGDGVYSEAHSAGGEAAATNSSSDGERHGLQAKGQGLGVAWAGATSTTASSSSAEACSGAEAQDGLPSAAATASQCQGLEAEAAVGTR